MCEYRIRSYSYERNAVQIVFDSLIVLKLSLKLVYLFFARDAISSFCLLKVLPASIICIFPLTLRPLNYFGDAMKERFNA
jgi:hypothetical protein